jgi:hypothetical protein
VTDLRDLTDRAKDVLTIADVWHRLQLPGEPRSGRVMKSPFREDRHGASFSLLANGKGFKDHADEAIKGDAVTFIQMALGCDPGTAMRQLIEMAGMGHYLRPVDGPAPPRLPPPAPRAIVPERGGWGPRRKPSLPTLLPVTAERTEALAKLRGLAPWAILAATERGLLKFASYWGRECWIVTDATGCNAQIRSLDGSLFTPRDGGDPIKGITLPNSWAGWPLGITTDTPGLLLVEGAPDLLAAVQFCEESLPDHAPVAMLGAAQPIHPGSLPHFKGRHVLIAEQKDPAKTRRDGSTYYPGQEAAARWAATLTPHAASVQILHLPPACPGKDLNDYLLWADRGENPIIPT